MTDEIRTKKFLFDYASKFLALPEDKVVAIFKREKCPIPFNPEHWDCYVKSLTGRKPCPICGSITIARDVSLSITLEDSKRFTHWTNAYPDGGICWYHPIHNAAWKMAHVAKLTMGVEFEKALLMVLGPVCEHEAYLIECKKCMKELVVQTHQNNPHDLASYFEEKVGVL